MDLSLDQSGGYLLVRRVGAQSITLLDRELSRSFLLAPDQAIENWPRITSRPCWRCSRSW
jgi:uncharacterized protein